LIYSGGQLIQVGGTSDAAPQWAGIIALANQARANANPSAGTLSVTRKCCRHLRDGGYQRLELLQRHHQRRQRDDRLRPEHGVGTPKVGNIITYLTGVTSFTLSAPTSSKAPTSPPPPNRNPFPFSFFWWALMCPHVRCPAAARAGGAHLDHAARLRISPAPVVASPFAGQLPAVNSPGSVFLRAATA